MKNRGFKNFNQFAISNHSMKDILGGYEIPPAAECKIKCGSVLMAVCPESATICDTEVDSENIQYALCDGVRYDCPAM